MSLQRIEIRRGLKPLLFSFKIFSFVLVISIIFQILFFLLSNPLIEHEIKIGCYDKLNFDVKSIENWYLEKGIKRIKISKNDDMLIINYWDHFKKGYKIRKIEIDICRALVEAISRILKPIKRMF